LLVNLTHQSHWGYDAQHTRRIQCGRHIQKSTLTASRRDYRIYLTNIAICTSKTRRTTQRETKEVIQKPTIVNHDSEEKNKTQDDSVVEQKNESLQNEVQQNEENKEPKVIKDRQVEIYYGFILDKFGGEKLSQRETPLYERLMDVALPLRDEAG